MLTPVPLARSSIAPSAVDIVLATGDDQQSGQQRSVRLIRMMRAFRLVKLFRLLKASRIIARILERTRRTTDPQLMGPLMTLQDACWGCHSVSLKRERDAPHRCALSLETASAHPRIMPRLTATSSLGFPSPTALSLHALSPLSPPRDAGVPWCADVTLSCTAQEVITSAMQALMLNHWCACPPHTRSP